MSAPEPTKGCETCKWFMRQDYGYSNYTTEGTEGHCLKRLNPHLPADLDAWGDKKSATEQALAFGETCPARTAGDGPWFDCDGDVTNESYKDDAELYAALLEYEKKESV